MPYKNQELRKEQSKKYYLRNKERIKAYHKVYYQIPINKTKRREYAKQYAREYSKRPERKRYYEEYRKNNIENQKRRSREHYLRNKDNIIIKQRDYYLKNKELVHTRHKEYDNKNKERVKQTKKEYHQKNREIRNRKHMEYNKKNKEKIKIYCQEWYKERKPQLIAEENKRRIQEGLPLVGEGFKEEMKLLFYIHKIFQNYEILAHHRKSLTDWGPRGLELDIYIPALKLAFEYMGEQHYRLRKFFHTKEEFEAQQYRDRCKKRLCKLKGITLIRIKYNEKLSEKLILEKMKYSPEVIINHIKTK